MATGGERLWNRNYIKAMVTNFTLAFSLYLLTPLLPIYLADTFAASKDTIGFVLSGYALAALLVRPFSGFMVDTLPRKAVLIGSLLAYTVVCGGYLVAGSLTLFAVVRTMHGAPFGTATVANSTAVIDVLPASRRTEGIGYYGLSNNLATAVAPTIGVFVYHNTHNFDLLFWMAFIAAAIGMANAYTMRLPHRERERDTRPVSLDRFFLLRGWVLAANMVLFGFCWGLMSNYLAIYGREQLGITGGTGTYFMLLSAGLIVSRLTGRDGLRKGLLLRNAAQGVVMSTVGYTLFILCPNMLGYYTSAILIGLGNGHMWPAFQNMIINVARHNERGTANSTILTSWDLGMGLGVLLGGVVAEYFGFVAAFAMVVAVHVAGLLLYLFVTRDAYRRRTLV